MVFNSVHFLLFFPMVCLAYFNLPYCKRWLFLLAASCFFYGYFIPQYLLILFLLIAIDYSAGIAIEGSSGAGKKFFLWLSLGSNILLLGLFKYFNFFSDNLANLAGLFGHKVTPPMLGWVLPIGLSFHTFQSMSYTIEVYLGRARAERHLGFYSLYVLFFPQLVAGPIERPQNLLDQFRRKVDFDPARATSGLRLMLLGMTKKVVIADGLAPYVAEVFDQPGKYGGSPVWAAIFLFAIQIFCDFSGYTDIARGSARILGIELMENFRSPYLASSIVDFWRRWHISLSTWFRDYVYIPLGGGHCSLGRRILNTFIIFGLSGLWHGANWTFVAWGLLHACYISTYLAAHSSSWFMKLKNALGEPATRIGTTMLTFFLVSIAWVFFRAPTVTQAYQLLSTALVTNAGHITSPSAPAHPSSVDSLSLTMALIGGAFLLVGQAVIQAKMQWPRFEDLLSKASTRLRYSFYAFQMLAILNAGSIKRVPFIYFQF